MYFSQPHHLNPPGVGPRSASFICKATTLWNEDGHDFMCDGTVGLSPASHLRNRSQMMRRIGASPAKHIGCIGFRKKAGMGLYAIHCNQISVILITTPIYEGQQKKVADRFPICIMLIVGRFPPWGARHVLRVRRPLGHQHFFGCARCRISFRKG